MRSNPFDLSALDGTNGLTLRGAGIADLTGLSVAAAGDLNNDGFDDILIGAPEADPLALAAALGGGPLPDLSNAVEDGLAFVVFGSSALGAGGADPLLALGTLNGVNGFIITGFDDGDGLGFSVNGAGDVNGDGIDDAIIGAPFGTRDAQDGIGEAYIVFGSTELGTTGAGASLAVSDLDGANGFVITGIDAGDQTGFSVAGAGDLNGDLIDDFLVSARDRNGSAGDTVVVFGSTGFGGTGGPSSFDLSSIDGANGFALNGIDAGDEAGSFVDGGGDINGDGLADLIIGAAEGDPASVTNAGESFVVFGSTALGSNGAPASLGLSSLDGLNGFVLNGGSIGDYAAVVSFTRDINGDHIDDLIVGAPFGDNTNSNAGESYVVFGSSAFGTSAGPASLDLTALNGTNGFVINGIDEDDNASVVSGAGDVNGDGLGDLLVGAPGPLAIDGGEGYVIFGSTGFSASQLDLSALDGSNGVVLNGIAAPLAAPVPPLLGTAVSNAGDVNGDGADDFLISAPAAGSTALTLNGDVFLVYGDDGIAPTAVVTTSEPDPTDTDPFMITIEFSEKVSGFDQADISVENGQIADFIAVSEKRFTAGVDADAEGTVTIDLPADAAIDRAGNGTAPASFSIQIEADGGPIMPTADLDLSQLDGTNGVTIQGISVNDRSGAALSNAGDINGDGIDDVVIGAISGDPNGKPSAGETYVVFGSTDLGATAILGLLGQPATQGFVLNGINAQDQSGSAVSGLGDVNGDGVDDLGIGAVNADSSTGSSGGQTYVLFGNSNFGATGGITAFELSSLDGTNGFVIEGPDTNDNTGFSLSGAGDLNGDSVADFIIGERNDSGDLEEAYVVFGSSVGFGGTLNLGQLDGTDGFAINAGRGVVNDNFGQSVSEAGDVNNDGFDDLIIGASLTQNGLAQAVGAAYVVFGRSDFSASDLSLSTLDGTNGFTILEAVPNDLFGAAVSKAGDLNHDGFDDVVISEPYGGAGGRGRAYVVFGTSDTSISTLTVSDLDGSNGFLINGANSLDSLGFYNTSVSTAGDFNGDGIDDLLLGADVADPDGSTAAGEAYVVFGSSTGFAASVDLSSLDGTNGKTLNGIDPNDQAGAAVGSGDFNGDGASDLLIGAPGANRAGRNDTGESYVVFGTTSAPPAVTVSTTEPSPTQNDPFTVTFTFSEAVSGFAAEDVTVSGGVVNGPLFTADNQVFTGVVNAFLNAEVTVSVEAGVALDASSLGNLASNTVSVQVDNSLLDLSTLDGSNGFVVNGVNALDQSGFAVSGAGDVNNDGFGDFIIGARYADAGATRSGETYVVFGGTDVGVGGSFDLSSLDGTNGFMVGGSDFNDQSGSAVSDLGDVNGDGIDDLLIGAPLSDKGNTNPTSEGESYVIFGASTGFDDAIMASALNGSNGFVLAGIDPGDRSGLAVSGAGDFNGDGVNDLLIGAFLADPGNTSAGETYVVFGGSTLGSGGLFDLAGLNGSNGFILEGRGGFDRSGRSVSSAGDVNNDGFDDLIVGAVSPSPNGQSSAGQSYVVLGTSGATPTNLGVSSLDGRNGFALNGVDPFDLAGLSVSGAGDVNGDGIDDFMIGAERADVDGDSDAGEVYVVFGSTEFGATGADASIELSSLDGSNGFVLQGDDANDLTGRSLSDLGDVNGDGIDDLLVSAVLADPHGSNNAGISYVVYGSQDIGGSGAWSLSSLDGANGFAINGIDPDDLSGQSVSGVGDVNGDGLNDLIIGAYLADPGGRNASGESYVVFGRDATAPTVAITSLDGTNTDTNPFTATFTFSEDVTGFDANDILVSGGILNGPVSMIDARTYTAAFMGDGPGVLSIDVVRGAAQDGAGNGSDAANPFLINVTEDTLALSSLNGSNGFVLHGISNGDQSGFAVSGAGDVNGDGLKDLLIGARYADGGAPNGGETYVVFGDGSLGASGGFDLSALNGSNGFTLLGIDADDRSGAAVSHLGDVNGDGIDDLLIGANQGDPDGNVGAGESYVVFGSSTGFNAFMDLSTLNGSDGFVLNGIDTGDRSGLAVSEAGDFNNDGINDLLIGAFLADPKGVNNAGETYLVFGDANLGNSGSLDLSDLNGTNGFVINGRGGADRTGRSVSSAGDVNGDGFDDIIVGAVSPSPNGQSSAGRGFVVFGTGAALAPSLDLSTLDGQNGFALNGIDPFDLAGLAVTGGHDLNGDGLDDMVIAAERADGTGGADTGEVYVVFGSASFGTGGSANALNLSALDGSNGFVLRGENGGDFAGRSVSSAEDVNGDGISDLVIGAVLADPNLVASAGQSYVVFGGTHLGADVTVDLSQLDGADGFALNGIDASDLSGHSVAGTGDVNGDGLGDLIIGAYRGDPNGNTNAGESYVVFGQANGRVIEGDAGDTVLTGTAGDDALRGAGGNDTLTGGGGDDLFVVGADFGDDVIVDFDQDGNDAVNARATGGLFSDFDGSDDGTIDAADAGLSPSVDLVNGGLDLRLTFADGSTLTFEDTTALGSDDIVF